MPTGYTAGILDGTTKDFKQFAKQCSRAFIIHLRDEPMDSEYKDREPSDYHLKELEKAKEKLKEVELLTDDEIATQRKSELIDSKKYHIKGEQKQKDDKKKMELFLSEAKAYAPPTKTHKGIGSFMIEQLEKTIDFDCSGTYHTNALKTIDSDIENVNAIELRAEMKTDALKDIDRHTKEYNKDLKRCEEHNKWYNDFIESLN